MCWEMIGVCSVGNCWATFLRNISNWAIDGQKKHTEKLSFSRLLDIRINNATRSFCDRVKTTKNYSVVGSIEHYLQYKNRNLAILLQEYEEYTKDKKTAKMTGPYPLLLLRWSEVQLSPSPWNLLHTCSEWTRYSAFFCLAESEWCQVFKLSQDEKETLIYAHKI